MNTYTIQVVTNPPRLDAALFGAKPQLLTVTVQGRTLAEAKRKAGIQ